MKFKKLLLLIPIIFLITGCSYDDININPSKININFRPFLITNTDEVKDVNIESIEIQSMNNEELNNLIEVIKTVYDKLGNEEHYLNTIGNSEEYYKVIKEYVDDNLYSNMIISNNNFLRKTFNEIYSTNKCGYLQTNIISVEFNEKLFVNVEVIAVENNSSIRISKQKLEINKEMKIENIETSPLEKVKNSSTPIKVENVKSHELFIENLDSLFKNISNKYLYDTYKEIENGDISNNDKSKEESLKEIEIQIKTLFDDSGLDKEILKEMFLNSNGEFQYGIKKCVVIEDKSIYTIQLIEGSYEITWNRLLNKITSIK